MVRNRGFRQQLLIVTGYVPQYVEFKVNVLNTG